MDYLIRKTLLILGSALFFSACSFHTGNISTGSPIDCPLIYIATGSAKTTRFLEIGGTNKEAMILEAKRDLYRKFPYNKGIKLSNFSVDYKNTYVLFWHTTKVTVSADVYDCNIIPNADTLESNLPLMINGFRVGDTVLYNSYDDGFVRAIIVSHHANDEVKISYYGFVRAVSHHANDEVKISYYSPSILDGKIEKTSYKNIFKTNKDSENINNFGFEIGEKVKVILLNKETGIKTKRLGVIKAINSEKAVIEYTNINNVVSSQIVEKQLLKK